MHSMESQLVSFSDTARAFQFKSTRKLRQSFWLFKLMSNPTLMRVISRSTVWAIHAGLPVESLVRNTVFRHFCGGESITESGKVVKDLERAQIGTILDFSVEGDSNEENFQKTKDEIIRIIQVAKLNPSIPYTSVKVTGLARLTLLQRVQEKSQLSQEEKVEFEEVRKRIHEICLNAYHSSLPVYFDAEESWIQETIDGMAEEMMQIFNKESCIVLTTLQMYRVDRLNYLKILIEKARTEEFLIGVKLVRGAYWEKEMNRAREIAVPSAVHISKQATDEDFDEAVSLCLRNLNLITLCAGTHNEESTSRLIGLMKELGIPNNHPNVFISQLYGMSDHITYNLAAEGYNVTKYVPYGPVRSVIPYLVRRAEENTAIAGQMSRELRMITNELKRRRQVQ